MTPEPTSQTASGCSHTALRGEPEAAGQDETGWLIEMKFGNGLLWWSGEFDRADDDYQRARLIARMVSDAGEAVRFARREDAQRVLDGMFAAKPCPVLFRARELYSAQEHMWPAPPQAASGSSQGARSDYPEAAALLCERFARDFTTTPPKNEFEHGVQTATTRLAEAFRGQPEALEPSGSTYGIIDPDYGRAYTIARKLAWEEGYAIGLHGSFTRDLDLVAVPWVEKPCEPFHLVRRIVAATGLKLRSETPGAKPQGRLVWTLLFPSFGDPRFVDFSVIPPARSGAGSEEAQPDRSEES